MSDASMKVLSPATIQRDLGAGLVVFLVALPLCLGVALASNAPLISGVVAGIIGGIVVGIVSGSHTSVSGPAAGLTAIVAAQLAILGKFEIFLAAVVVGGVIQIALGIARAGFIASFFPSSVIKGLLAAIGVILILKQIPHLLGRDSDPEGEMAFFQPDQENTFSELVQSLGSLHIGAVTIGIASILLIILWEKRGLAKLTRIPAPLAVVALGVGLNMLFDRLGGAWHIEGSHLVQVPVAESRRGLKNFLTFPDFAQFANPAIYTAGATIAMVASLETLLNLEAVDKLDPLQRPSPSSRELVAQGIGNICSGLVGGIPVTSVIVRSSVNIYAGAHSKLSTIFHGILLLFCVAVLPVYLNMIPLSCLAAVLFMTGLKLASPALFSQMWSEGRYQFIPFVVTVVAVVFTDLVSGVVIGLTLSISFILYSNVRRPLRRIREKHLGGEVMKIELANQVSFLNRAAIDRALDDIPRGGHVLLDATNTVYIDPDVLSLIREFNDQKAPVRGVNVSLRGFRDKYQIENHIQYVEYATRDLQAQMTPRQVLKVLQDGNERFRTGHRLTRDLGREVKGTAEGQHPLAVVLSCIDSRSPVELILDLGLGDVFGVRIAGNITSKKVLGSIEYGCAVAGAKLVLVLGHTRCGAVTAAVKFSCSNETGAEATGCQHIDEVLGDIQQSVDSDVCVRLDSMTADERTRYVDWIARRNVLNMVRAITAQSETLDKLVQEGRIAVVGGMYDVSTGAIEFMVDDPVLVTA